MKSTEFFISLSLGVEVQSIINVRPEVHSKNVINEFLTVWSVSAEAKDKKFDNFKQYGKIDSEHSKLERENSETSSSSGFQPGKGLGDSCYPSENRAETNNLDEVIREKYEAIVVSNAIMITFVSLKVPRNFRVEVGT